MTICSFCFSLFDHILGFQRLFPREKGHQKSRSRRVDHQGPLAKRPCQVHRQEWGRTTPGRYFLSFLSKPFAHALVGESDKRVWQLLDRARLRQQDNQPARPQAGRHQRQAQAELDDQHVDECQVQPVEEDTVAVPEQRQRVDRLFVLLELLHRGGLLGKQGRICTWHWASRV